MSRYKRVIGETLKSRDDARRETEVAIAVKSLNRMRDFGRAIAPVLRKQPRAGANARFAISMQQVSYRRQSLSLEICISRLNAHTYLARFQVNMHASVFDIGKRMEKAANRNVEFEIAAAVAHTLGGGCRQVGARHLRVWSCGWRPGGFRLQAGASPSPGGLYVFERGSQGCRLVLQLHFREWQFGAAFSIVGAFASA